MSEQYIMKVLNSNDENNRIIKLVIIKNLPIVLIKIQFNLSGDETFLLHDMAKYVIK